MAHVRMHVQRGVGLLGDVTGLLDRHGAVAIADDGHRAGRQVGHASVRPASQRGGCDVGHRRHGGRHVVVQHGLVERSRTPRVSVHPLRPVCSDLLGDAVRLVIGDRTGLFDLDAAEAQPTQQLVLGHAGAVDAERFLCQQASYVATQQVHLPPTPIRSFPRPPVRPDRAAASPPSSRPS